MASKEGDGKNNGDLIAFAAVLLIVLMMAPFYWKHIKPPLSRFVVQLAVAESKALLLISPVLTDGYVSRLKTVRRSGSLALCNGGVIKEEFRDTIKPSYVLNGIPYKCRNGNKQFAQIPFNRVIDTLSIPARSLAVIWFFVAGWMVYSLRMTDMVGRFRRTFDMDQFVRYMAKSNPVLIPIVDEKIDEQDPYKGPWRVARNYIDFAIDHQLLRFADGDLVIDTRSTFKAQYFDRAKLHEVLTQQLGGLVRDGFSEMEEAIFGMCAAMIAQESEKADRALIHVFKSWKKDKKTGVYSVNTETLRALAQKFGNHSEVLEMKRKHAHVRPLLSAMLDVGRKRSGVRETSQFLWLKPIDRPLFYAIQGAGFPSALTEAMGVQCHRTHERRKAFALTTPHVEEAILGYRQSLINEGWLNSAAVDWAGEAVGGYAASPQPSAR